MRRTKAFAVVMLACIVMGGISLPSGAAATVHVVRRGESIQAAIDAAAPGDTISVHRGVFREYLQIIDKSITLVGRRGTVLNPPTGPTGTCPEVVSPEGHGICVIGTSAPVDDVTLRNLRVEGFSGFGVIALDTENLTVQQLRSQDNGFAGILGRSGRNSAFLSNVVLRNGEVGLAMFDSTGADSRIVGNIAEGNPIGVKVEAGVGVVQDNKLRANCAGISASFAILNISRNKVRGDPDCASGPGIGIFSTGRTVVSHNLVRGSQANGIAVYGGFANSIERNVARHNAPFDLFYDGTDTRTTFPTNQCGTSNPAGLCT